MSVIAVVIPCYKVTSKIQNVLAGISEAVTHIICVDDACPDKSGAFIKKTCNDTRVSILLHEKNQGVGGAVVTGYREALQRGADIIVKIDGDGQMNPALIPIFVAPIEKGYCDYTKGNRFFSPEYLEKMPRQRLIGNGILSFLTKFSSGYWDVFDPTNGYTAIHAKTLKEIMLEKVSKTYFFESDMLFRLNIIRAAIRDIPMPAIYDDEQSNLKISKILWPFLLGHMRNCTKRIIYNYFVRDFSIGSLYLLFGLVLFFFGLIFGAFSWWQSVHDDINASAGTVMLSALPLLLGVQMLLSFLQFDIQAVPRHALHKMRL